LTQGWSDIEDVTQKGRAQGGRDTGRENTRRELHREGVTQGGRDTGKE